MFFFDQSGPCDGFGVRASSRKLYTVLIHRTVDYREHPGNGHGPTAWTAIPNTQRRQEWQRSASENVAPDYLCYKGDNLKNTHARVMVLVHDTSSQCALQTYDVSLKYL